MTSDKPPLIRYPEGNTGLFWDVEDYPILGGLCSESLYQTIKDDLRRSRYSGDVSVHFFGPGPGPVVDKHPKIKTTVLPRGSQYVREMTVHIQVWALLNPPPSNIIVLSKKINYQNFHRYASLYQYHYGVVLSDPKPGWLLPITSSAPFFSRRILDSEHKVDLYYPTTSSVPQQDSSWKWILTRPRKPPVGVFLDLSDLPDNCKPGLLLDKISELVEKEGGGVFYVHAVCQEDEREHLFSQYVNEYQFLVRGIPTKEEAVIWMLNYALFWTLKQAEPGQLRQPVKILLLSNGIQNDHLPNLHRVSSCLKKLECSLTWKRPNTLIRTEEL